MILNLNNTIRTAEATVIANAINAGSAAGSFNYYNGTQPARGGAATTLVATQTLAYPCQTSITNGVITFDAIGNGGILVGTTITWMRCKDSTGAFVFDMDVTDFSPVFATYSVTTLQGLMTHFGVSTVPNLMAALSAADLALLGSMVLSTITYNPGEYIIIPGNITLTVA